MKSTGVLLALSLALCCFSAVSSNDENDETKVFCDKYFIYEDFLVCPRVFRRVCGTNGKTYPHECKICEENLNSGQNTGKKYSGPCAEETYCGIRVSPTPECTGEDTFHCASNGKTYNTKCEFCNAVWESVVPLTLKHSGKCESTL